MQFSLPNRVVNIGQDVQWNVNKHMICKLSITDCIFLEIFYFDYQVKMVVVKWISSQIGPSQIGPKSNRPQNESQFGTKNKNKKRINI